MTMFPKLISVFVLGVLPFTAQQPQNQPSVIDTAITHDVQSQDIFTPTLFDESSPTATKAHMGTFLVGVTLVSAVFGIVVYKGKGKCVEHPCLQSEEDI